MLAQMGQARPPDARPPAAGSAAAYCLRLRPPYPHPPAPAVLPPLPGRACDHKDGKDCEKDHKKKDDHKKHKKWTPIPHYTSVRDCIQ